MIVNSRLQYNYVWAAHIFNATLTFIYWLLFFSFLFSSVCVGFSYISMKHPDGLHSRQANTCDEPRQRDSRQKQMKINTTGDSCISITGIRFLVHSHCLGSLINDRQIESIYFTFSLHDRLHELEINPAGEFYFVVPCCCFFLFFFSLSIYPVSLRLAIYGNKMSNICFIRIRIMFHHYPEEEEEEQVRAPKPTHNGPHIQHGPTVTAQSISFKYIFVLSIKD